MKDQKKKLTSRLNEQKFVITIMPDSFFGSGEKSPLVQKKLEKMRKNLAESGLPE